MLQLQRELLAAWENEEAAGLSDEGRRGGGESSVPIGSPRFAPPFPRRLSKVERERERKKKNLEVPWAEGSQLWVLKGTALKPDMPEFKSPTAHHLRDFGQVG